MSIHSVVGDSAQGTNCVDIIPTVLIPIQQKATATRQNPTALGENQGKEGATEEIPMPSEVTPNCGNRSNHNDRHPWTYPTCLNQPHLTITHDADTVPGDTPSSDAQSFGSEGPQ